MQKIVLFLLVLSVSSLYSMDPTSPRLRRDSNHAISPRLSLGVAGAPEERRRMEELTDTQRAAIMNLNIIKKQLAVGKAEGLIPDAFFKNCESKKKLFPNDARIHQEINGLIKEAQEINAPLVEKN